MSTALVAASSGLAPAGSLLPPVPWRDPHTVSPEKLSTYIAQLEQACLDNPRSADLRTCLGMAHAVNFDIDQSMDSLEVATGLDPDHFWARMKYAELHYRLRALNRAEEETLKALDLACNPMEEIVARRQLKEIRGLKTNCARNVEWTKPLLVPTLVLSVMFALAAVIMTWS